MIIADSHVRSRTNGDQKSGFFWLGWA